MPQIAKPPIIDVEASGFGAASYPIEIGIALASGDRYSTLIKPAPDWTHWDPEAAKVHRLSRDMLFEYGKSIKEVAVALNKLLIGQVVYSDAWVVDKPWIIKLYYRAGLSLQFSISQIELILSQAQITIWKDIRDKVIRDCELQRHRASADAFIIQQTYLRSLAGTKTSERQHQPGSRWK